MNNEKKVATTKKTWAEFRDSKLLWWINRILHTFGWAIVYRMNGQGEITEVYPARVTYRGFSQQSEEDGFNGMARYLKIMASELDEEIKG